MENGDALAQMHLILSHNFYVQESCIHSHPYYAPSLVTVHKAQAARSAVNIDMSLNFASVICKLSGLK